MDVIRDQCHLLDYLLLEQELGKVLLQLVVQFVKLAKHLLGATLGSLAPSEVFLVHLAVLFADFLDEAVQRLEVLVASLDHLVQGYAIESLLRGIGSQFFCQRDVLLRGEAQSVENPLHLKLGVLDSLGDFHLLLTREQRHLTHLLEIHPDGIVENIQSGLLGFRRGLGWLLSRGSIKLLHDLHLEALQFFQNLLEFFRGHQIARQRVVDVSHRQVTLILCELYEFLNLLLKIKLLVLGEVRFLRRHIHHLFAFGALLLLLSR